MIDKGRGGESVYFAQIGDKAGLSRAVADGNGNSCCSEPSRGEVIIFCLSLFQSIGRRFRRFYPYSWDA